MARTVDPRAYAKRRGEILDAAQRLVMSKGYERMSIQDVREQVGISKGALYHYFGSKQELLAGIADRTADEIRDQLESATADPERDALGKLAGLFEALAGWKVQHRDELVSVLRVWYSDDNTVLRQRLRVGISDRLAPLFEAVVEQGTREGTFAAAPPRELGRLLVSLLQDLNNRLAELFFASQATEAREANRSAVEDAVTAHTIALERILGVPIGSVRLVDPALVHAWIDAATTPEETQPEETTP